MLVKLQGAPLSTARLPWSELNEPDQHGQGRGFGSGLKFAGPGSDTPGQAKGGTLYEGQVWQLFVKSLSYSLKRLWSMEV